MIVKYQEYGAAWLQNNGQTYIWQKTSCNPPLWASYGVYFVTTQKSPPPWYRLDIDLTQRCQIDV